MSLAAAITHLEHRVLEGKRTGRVNPFGSAFYQDLMRDYQREIDLNTTAECEFITFEELCGAVLDTLARSGCLEGVDLMVVAHWLPNCIAYHSTTAYLANRFGLAAFTFAVSDQGTGCGHTGLRLVADYLRSGKARKALLLAVDQTSLPVPAEVVRERKVVSSAAGLVVEAGGAGGMGLVGQRRAAVSPGEIPEEVRRFLAEQGVGAESVLALSEASLLPMLAEIAGLTARPTASEHLVTAPFHSLKGDWLATRQSSYCLLVDHSFGTLRLTLLRMEVH
jgi:hypothetical protein